MKKSFITAILILVTSIIYAQIDTTPIAPGSMPHPPMDTFNRDRWKTDTLQRNNQWNDTLGRTKNAQWSTDSNYHNEVNKPRRQRKDSAIGGSNNNQPYARTYGDSSRHAYDTSRKMTRDNKNTNRSMQSSDSTSQKTGLYNNKSGMSSGTKESMPAKKVSDRVMMKEGKVIIVRNGKEQKVTQTTTLDNGMIVMADGTIKIKGGTTMKIKNGEHVELEPAKNKKNK